MFALKTFSYNLVSYPANNGSMPWDIAIILDIYNCRRRRFSAIWHL